MINKSPDYRVREWNRRCGKFPQQGGSEEYWESLNKQLDRVLEEAEEIREAIEKRDSENLLKELCDLSVVSSGLNYLSNLNLEEAIHKVLDDNDHKYTTNKSLAEDWRFYWARCGVKVKVSWSVIEGVTYYSVMRIPDGKIMKVPKRQTLDLTNLID